MPEYFYSCVDCPEHTMNVKMDNKDEFHPLLDYCEYHQRFFSKSFPMRETPCLDMLLNADNECPICGEVMDVIVRGKRFV